MRESAILDFILLWIFCYEYFILRWISRVGINKFCVASPDLIPCYKNILLRNLFQVLTFPDYNIYDLKTTSKQFPSMTLDTIWHLHIPGLSVAHRYPAKCNRWTEGLLALFDYLIILLFYSGTAYSVIDRVCFSYSMMVMLFTRSIREKKLWAKDLRVGWSRTNPDSSKHETFIQFWSKVAYVRTTLIQS